MKRRRLFALFAGILVICFLKGVFMPVNNGITAVTGVALILVGTITTARTAMFLEKHYRNK